MGGQELGKAHVARDHLIHAVGLIHGAAAIDGDELQTPLTDHILKLADLIAVRVHHRRERLKSLESQRGNLVQRLLEAIHAPRDRVVSNANVCHGCSLPSVACPPSDGKHFSQLTYLLAT